MKSILLCPVGSENIGITNFKGNVLFFLFIIDNSMGNMEEIMEADGANNSNKKWKR